MPLTAIRHIRKMRGGAQSHLMEADDGQWYVVKFRNNPQHHRVLVNELLASRLLAYLRSEEHTSELQSLRQLVCRLLLEKKLSPLRRGRQNRRPVRPHVPASVSHAP